MEEKTQEQLEALSQEERIDYYSEKIFNKKAKDIKYLLLSEYIHDQLLSEDITRTGLYQWLNVFDGEIKLPREVDDYSKYDIIQINMSAQDIHLVRDVKERLGTDTKTKVILNNDYTTEMWQSAFDYPSTMSREINGADMLFGTEYFQVTALSELSGRKAYIIPHPADVKRLKSIIPIPKKNILSTIWRRYDNFYWIPHLATRNHGMTTQLLGYDKDVDKKVWVATTLFDMVSRGTNYFEFTDQLRESKIVYNPFTFHSYDRTTVDCAALGVPVVGSNRTQSMQICYPETCVDPYDVHTSRYLISRLNEDKAFYDHVVEVARKNVEFYNHLNSKERYLMSLDDALFGKDIKKEKKTAVFEKGMGQDIHGDLINERNKTDEEKIVK